MVTKSLQSLHPFGTLKEAEPNDTFAAAQAVTVLPSKVTGSFATIADVDWYRVTIAGGKRVVATLAPGVNTTAVGLGVYLTATQPLMSIQGAAGQILSMTLTNGGTAPVTVAYRVWRPAGAIGAYSLSLTN